MCKFSLDVARLFPNINNCFSYLYFLSIETYQPCLHKLLNLNDFTSKLSYPALLPLCSHLFALLSNSHSLLHHLPTAHTWLWPGSNLTAPPAREIAHVQMLSTMFSSAPYSLWLLITYRIKVQFLHHLALPTCSASSSAGPYLHFTGALIPWLCCFPPSTHLHIYFSCLKCPPPPTQQLEHIFSFFSIQSSHLMLAKCHLLFGS